MPKKTLLSGDSPTPSVAAPEPTRCASLRELRTAWRAERKHVLTLGGHQAEISWHPLTDAEREPIVARTRLAIPPLKPGENGAPPTYDRQDAGYVARRQRVETQARALAVFYGVPELRREFQQRHGAAALPAPDRLGEAEVEAITAFLCGPETGMPPEFMVAVERLVLGEFDVAEEVERLAAVF
ncbi:MAG TPA: hypothetical protein VMB21_01255 [Candidatus Limnocylindria bacterium]|jgi:hypothetical protein|nr:hypothetical protein [Candidatus Limnocylindria bacterium]